MFQKFGARSYHHACCEAQAIDSYFREEWSLKGNIQKAIGVRFIPRNTTSTKLINLPQTSDIP